MAWLALSRMAGGNQMMSSIGNSMNSNNQTQSTMDNIMSMFNQSSSPGMESGGDSSSPQIYSRLTPPQSPGGGNEDFIKMLNSLTQMNRR